MRKVLGVCLLATMTQGIPAAQAPQGSTSHPTFTSAVDVVPISAIVRDSRGRLITTLREPDFQVLDKGEPRRLLDFQIDHSSALTVAVLVDTSGSMRIGHKLSVARDALAQLGRTLQDGRDELGLFTFDAKVHQQRAFSKNLAGLDLLDVADPFGATSLYDAVAETAKRLAERPGSRRAIVVVTDGVDTSSTLSPAEVSAFASSIDVPLYVIATVMPIDRPTGAVVEDQTPQSQLEDLARWTGGNLLWASTSTEAVLGADQVISELRQQYLMAIESSHERGWRPLDVRVSDRRLAVRARSGYFARE